MYVSCFLSQAYFGVCFLFPLRLISFLWCCCFQLLPVYLGLHQNRSLFLLKKMKNYHIISDITFKHIYNNTNDSINLIIDNHLWPVNFLVLGFTESKLLDQIYRGVRFEKYCPWSWDLLFLTYFLQNMDIFGQIKESKWISH